MSNFLVEVSNPKVRWVFLALCCICSFTEMYNNDLPMPLSYKLQHVDLHISSFKYNLLYTVEAMPSIFIGFFAGIMSEKFEATHILIFAWISELFGQILITFGKLDFLSKNILIWDWFIKYEISFAFGFTLMMARLGTTLVGFCSPFLYKIDNSLIWPVLVSLALAFLSLISSFVILYLDRKYLKRTIVNDSEALIETKKEGTFEKLKNMGFIFWIYFFSMFLFMGTFATFVANTYDILILQYGLTPENAAIILLLSFILTVTGPCFGSLLDKIGQRLYFYLFGMTLYTLILLFVIYWPLQNFLIFLPFLFVGIVFSLYSCTYFPCLKAILLPKYNSMGNTLVMAGYNFSTVLNTMLFGLIRDNSESEKHGFLYSYWLLIGQAIVNVGLCIIILAYNHKNKGNLNEKQLEK